MRIDKYLWCMRYFKTRSLATMACRKGQIKVNDYVIKSSREVYKTDKITIRKNQINYQLVVNDIPQSRIAAKLLDIYRTDTTPKSEFNIRETLKYSKNYYRKKGIGRPTKKDRRDMDGFYAENE